MAMTCFRLKTLTVWRRCIACWAVGGASGKVMFCIGMPMPSVLCVRVKWCFCVVHSMCNYLLLMACRGHEHNAKGQLIHGMLMTLKEQWFYKVATWFL